MQIYSLFESTLRFLFIADRNEETIAEFVAGILWRKKENSKPWAILPRIIDEYQQTLGIWKRNWLQIPWDFHSFYRESSN